MTPSSISTSILAGCCDPPCRCGTRRWLVARSPTRTSAICPRGGLLLGVRSARVGVPTWVAQRLWLGTLLFAAGAGVCHLARTLGAVGPGVIVARLAYELSPYSLQYIQQTSAILLPWASLGFWSPFAHPSLFGRALRAFMSGSSVGLALRPSDTARDARLCHVAGRGNERSLVAVPPSRAWHRICVGAGRPPARGATERGSKRACRSRSRPGRREGRDGLR
jgi:hypothetical protein